MKDRNSPAGRACRGGRPAGRAAPAGRHAGALWRCPLPDTARPPACGGGLLLAKLRVLRQGLLSTTLSR